VLHVAQAVEVAAGQMVSGRHGADRPGRNRAAFGEMAANALLTWAPASYRKAE
jgi:hypothetical protein